MTFEENKQQLIVRQSQMERAIEFYTLLGLKPTALELMTTADVFSDYIMNRFTPEVKLRVSKIDEFLLTKRVVKQITE
jgi:hypothetical protein